MSGLVETYRSLSAAFQELGLRWYVFGAQAAIFHGVARATADIDVTIEPGRCSTMEIASALARHELGLRISDEAFIEQTRVLPVAHTSGVPVDVVLAGPGLEELFFERVVHRTVTGVSIPVASAEDVVVMKILAGRPKDLDDVRGIVSAKRADLDVAQIRETMSMLEEALDQSDLLPVFEQIWTSQRR